MNNSRNILKRPKMTQKRYRNEQKKKKNKNIRKYSERTEGRSRIDLEKAHKRSIRDTEKILMGHRKTQRNSPG